MRKRRNDNIIQIALAFALIAAIFCVFAYVNWNRIKAEWWFELAGETIAVFGPLIFRMRADIKGWKVFLVLAVLCAMHMWFNVYFLARGFHIRPLFYVPVAIAELAISIFVLVALAGARLEAYRGDQH